LKTISHQDKHIGSYNPLSLNVKKRNFMSKSLVIGGAGYVGSVLVERLLLNNRDVTVVDNFSHGVNSLKKFSKAKRLKVYNENIFNLNKLDVDLKKYKYIYPLSGLVGDPSCKMDKRRTLRENVDSLRYLLDKDLNQDSKIIYPSSCSVYGLINETANEKHELNPQSLYAETKIICESMLKNLPKKNVIILRLPTIFGVSNRMRFDLVVNKMTFDLIKKNKITVFNPYSERPLLSTFDLANILLKSQRIKNKFYSYNIGSANNNYSLEKIAREIVLTLHNQIKGSKMIEYHDEIDDKRSYSINLDRFEKEFKVNNFVDFGYEVLKIFRYIKKMKKESINSKKFLNYKI